MFKSSFTYADIGLVPREVSTIHSRSIVDTSQILIGAEFGLPIISAPMKTVSGPLLNRAFREEDAGMCILPRTQNLKKDLEDFGLAGIDPVFVSLGITGDYMERFQEFRKYGVNHFCIEVANGFHEKVRFLAEKLKKEHTTKRPVYLIAGNVASSEGFNYLSPVVDGIRVGIGGGAACTTSINTGIGRGMVDLLLEVSKERDLANSACLVIADGGVKEPGDILKALVLGADLVMLGSMLSGTEEAPGQVISYQGKKYKIFAGEASSFSKGEDGGYIEGEQTLVPFKGPVSEVIKKIREGLQSGMAYLDCQCISDIKNLDLESTVILLSKNAREERRSF